MKRWIAGFAALLALSGQGSAQAEGLPDALIYISPHEYTHEVRLGVPPYFSGWVMKGPVVEAAAREALGPLFSRVDLCDGSSGADVVVWVKPQLNYNPLVKRYYAKVKAQFHLGNGKQVGVYKAMGEQEGAIASVYADQQVRQAYDEAMRDIVRQFNADTAAQQAIADAHAANQTKSPCALIGAIPNP